MKFWLKYRRNSSAGSGAWEWMMLYSDTLEGAESEAEEVASNINSEYHWSEHHRGVDWEIETEAPKHIVEARLKGTISAIERFTDNLIRLAEEAKTAKECECVGEREYSSSCKICGRTLKKVTT